MTLSTPGARLRVHVDGPSADPIILLHGGPGVPDYLAPVASLLSEKHRVVRYDQRGAGGSSARDGRYGLDDHVADLEAVRASLELPRVSLFGHSWGGLLAQLYAQRHPERVQRVFLCNSSVGLGADWRAMEREVMGSNRRRGGALGFVKLGWFQLRAMLPFDNQGAQRMMAEVWRNYFDPPSSAPAPDPEWLAGIPSIVPMMRTRSAVLAAAASDLGAVPPSIEVLSVYGEHDIYGDTTSLLTDRNPRARHVVLAGSGHLPWLQSPTAFAELLHGFFDTPRALRSS